MAITPYLLYEDVGEALAFLSNAFGFRSCDDAVQGADGKINHASMQLGKDLVMMGCPGTQYRNPKHLGGVTQNLYVNVESVDEHFARAKKAGATILQEPTNTQYGHRRYGAADPEGHVWYFAEDIPKPNKS